MSLAGKMTGEGESRAEEERTHEPSRKPVRGAVAALGWGLHGGIAFASLGLLIRLTIRDRLLIPGMVFYATPLLAIVCAFAAGAAWHAWRGRRLLPAVLCVLAIGTAVGWYARSHVSNRPEPADDTVRLMFWNAARLRDGIEPVIAHIQRYDPDIVALVEARTRTAEQQRVFREVFRGYDVRTLHGGMLLLSRLPVESTDYFEVSDRGRVNVARLRVRETPVALAIVDIHSSPYYNRGNAIAEVFQKVAAGGERARIVAGDFNTPRSSVHFDDVQEEWDNAFESAGSGWMETWPWGLPLLALDHVWLQGPVRAAGCRHLTAGCSDHQSVLTEVALER